MLEGGASDRIKSTAVVQYASVEAPAQYHELQRNTDLKQPPANWLQANSKQEAYMRGVSFGKGDFLSSFRIGHCYPHLTGEIDVVSDGENIKKLLKMPYSNGHVSLMVHRIDNTLLLDDFDIHKHLLRQQEKDWQWLRKFYYETVLNSMRDSVKAQTHVIKKKKKSRDHLQHRNMFSKFLYYSINQGNPEEETLDPDEISSPDHQKAALSTSSTQHAHQKAALSTSSTQHAQEKSDTRPKVEEEQPQHQRAFVWTFEDIRMLFGTDLPIFGGGSHPCVSLRLRDMQQPINVLTGLDYWLDNLMCNVPELAMCYHLDGIVQSYQLIKTEDIPHIPNSEFSPGVVRDVAQNILSFLKANATKEGHTYWLFKGHGDDIVKLYDLTSLCSDISEEPGINPFTIPVGMLLYRVGRNLRQSQGRKKSGTIRQLLKSCLQLLDRDAHPQVVTSAHFLLCDLYVADSLWQPSPEISDEEEEEEEEQESTPGTTMTQTGDPAVDGPLSCSVAQPHHPALQTGDPAVESGVEGPLSCSVTQPGHPTLQTGDPATQPHHPAVESEVEGPLSCSVTQPRHPAAEPEADGRLSCVAVPALSLPCIKPAESKVSTRLQYPPISGSVRERCTEAISHIAQGLSCLDDSIRKTETPSSNPDATPHAEEFQASCDPRTAIPLHYHSQQPPTGNHGDSCHADSTQISVLPITQSSLPRGTWQHRSKTLLIQKSALAYYGIAEACLEDDNLGAAWKCLTQAVFCCATLEQLCTEAYTHNLSLFSTLLTLCGDLHLRLSRNLGDVKTLPETVALTENDRLILVSLRLESQVTDYDWLTPFCPSSEENMERSMRSYRLAHQVAVQAREPSLRLETLARRCGNVHNEHGVQLMKKAAARISEDSTDTSATVKEALSLAQTSHDVLREGIQWFSNPPDLLNMALLNANLGRLHRLCAEIVGVQARQGTAPTSKEFSPLEAHYFTMAQESYSEAVQLLQTAGTNTDVRNSVAWELSSVYFTMASLLQDYAPLSTKAQQQVEQEVVRLMEKALAAVGGDLAQDIKVLYRSATIHHRLASLHHNAYRNQVEDKLLRYLRNKAEEHYSEASVLFLQTESPCELLRVQLERVALEEYILNNLTSPLTRLRTLRGALDKLCCCHSALDTICHQVSAPSQEVSVCEEEAEKLIGLLLSRLQAVSMNLVKNAQQKGKKSSSAQLGAFKAICSRILRTEASDLKLNLVTRCQHLSKTLAEVEELISQLRLSSSGDTAGQEAEPTSPPVTS